MFADYVRAGWALVPLSPRDKRPVRKGWNRPESVVTDPQEADTLEAAGLAHAYSGTCAIDIDDLEAATAKLFDQGIELIDLIEAPDAVAITSGRANRYKLLFSTDQYIPSTKLFGGAIEMRCATRGGRTVQDALPPTVHPGTGQPYRWSLGMVGIWQYPPPLPESLYQLWMAHQPAQEDTDLPAVDSHYSSQELEQLVAHLDPDTDYEHWVSIGMALHAATGGGEDGFEVWDRWSSQGSKYKGWKDLQQHWHSFSATGDIGADYLEQYRTAEPADFDNEDPYQPIPIGRWAQRPPPQWIIDQVLPKTDLAMIYGAPSTGKTFFAMDLAFALGGGLPWWGHETTALPVAWIAAEAPGSIRNRSLAIGHYHRTSLDSVDLWVVGHTPNFQQTEEVKRLAEACRSVEAKVVFVDTLSAVAGGANENSGEDMSVILAACRALHRATDALVVLIHHSGKDASKGARGWSGIKAAVDLEIEVSHVDGGPRVAKIVKQRDGVAGVEYPFRLAPIELAPYDGRPQHSCAVEPIEVARMFSAVEHPGWPSLAVMALLISDTCSNDDIVEIMDRTELAGEGEVDSQHALKRLFDTGLVIETSGGVELA